MSLFRTLIPFLGISFLLMSHADAQHYGGHVIIHPQPSCQIHPIYPAPPIHHPILPPSCSHCGHYPCTCHHHPPCSHCGHYPCTCHHHNPCSHCGHSPCNCDCNHCLDCEIRLSHHCDRRTCSKTPIPFNIIGHIPKINEETNCYVTKIDFQAPTKVPYVICKTHRCVEIGKRAITCLPGCTFSLCVPIAECCETVLTCELRDKMMKLRAWKRDNGSYDVYVLNEASGAFSAGGMPEKWLVMHCASKAQVESKFPSVQVTARDGKPVSQRVVMTPHRSKPTTADTEMELVISKTTKDADSAHQDETAPNTQQAMPTRVTPKTTSQPAAPPVTNAPPVKLTIVNLMQAKVASR